MNKIGYIRVSKTAQDLSRQLQIMKEHGITKVFQEKYSAAKKWQERPELTKMLDCCLREGDVVYVVAVDRIARSLRDLFMILERIHAKGARVFCLDTSKYYPAEDWADNFIMTILAMVAELENDIRRKRINQGIAASDRSKWRRRGRSAFTDEELNVFAEEWARNKALPLGERLYASQLVHRMFGKNGRFPKEKVPSVIYICTQAKKRCGYLNNPENRLFNKPPN